MPFQVAVCGPRHCTPQEERHARRVGGLLAGRGAVVICGAGTGVMAAAAAGAHTAGGVVIGVRPDADRDHAHPDLTATVETNMGEARNAIIVQSADAVIAVGGSWGTLSEIALAMRRGTIPVVTLEGWQILNPAGMPVPGITAAGSPEEAVDLALTRAGLDG